MTRSAISLVVLLAAGAASAAAPVFPSAGSSADALIREAAQAEKADGCEVAYNKYKDAQEQLSSHADKARAAQLEGVVANKLDKLEACYRSCQPNDRQKELFATAKDVAGTEPHRSARILRQLLVGRSVDRCTFWSDARTLLRTLPGQADSLDQDQADPCSLTPELSKSLADAKDAVRKERSAVAELNYERAKIPARMNDLADLVRGMDQTRMLLVELREGFIECDSVSKELTQESSALRESMTLAQDMVVGTYKEQIASVGKKLKAAQARIAHQDDLITQQIGEEAKLKMQFEQLSNVSEELYNDLFALSQAESVSFAVEVEGRRVEQPLDEVKALLGNEKKVLETLSSKYPEYFKDGVNVEGLKRKKLVLEKVSQMMKRFAGKADKSPSYSRAVAEMGATLEMMDKAIDSAGPVAHVAAADVAGNDTGIPTWLLGAGGVLAVAGLTALRIRSSMKE